AATVACGSSTEPSPGPASKLVFTVQPRSSPAGTEIVPAVLIQDASGNTVTTATNAVTVALGTNPAGGTLSGTTTVNAVNGVATFPGLWINKAASGYTLVASASALITDTSATFTITPASATTLVLIVQPPTFAERAQFFAPAVEVAIRDSFNNTV